MYQVCYFSLVSFELIEWIEDPSGGQSKKQARVDIPKVKTMNEKKKIKAGLCWESKLSFCFKLVVLRFQDLGDLSSRISEGRFPDEIEFHPLENGYLAQIQPELVPANPIW